MFKKLFTKLLNNLDKSILDEVIIHNTELYEIIVRNN